MKGDSLCVMAKQGRNQHGGLDTQKMTGRSAAKNLAADLLFFLKKNLSDQIRSDLEKRSQLIDDESGEICQQKQTAGLNKCHLP